MQITRVVIAEAGGERAEVFPAGEVLVTNGVGPWQIAVTTVNESDSTQDIKLVVAAQMDGQKGGSWIVEAARQSISAPSGEIIEGMYNVSAERGVKEVSLEVLIVVDSDMIVTTGLLPAVEIDTGSSQPRVAKSEPSSDEDDTSTRKKKRKTVVGRYLHFPKRFILPELKIPY